VLLDDPDGAGDAPAADTSEPASAVGLRLRRPFAALDGVEKSLVLSAGVDVAAARLAVLGVACGEVLAEPDATPLAIARSGKALMDESRGPCPGSRAELLNVTAATENGWPCEGPEFETSSPFMSSNAMVESKRAKPISKKPHLSAG